MWYDEDKEHAKFEASFSSERKDISERDRKLADALRGFGDVKEEKVPDLRGPTSTPRIPTSLPPAGEEIAPPPVQETREPYGNLRVERENLAFIRRAKSKVPILYAIRRIPGMWAAADRLERDFDAGRLSIEDLRKVAVTYQEARVQEVRRSHRSVSQPPPRTAERTLPQHRMSDTAIARYQARVRGIDEPDNPDYEPSSRAGYAPRAEPWQGTPPGPRRGLGPKAQGDITSQFYRALRDATGGTPALTALGRVQGFGDISAKIQAEIATGRLTEREMARDARLSEKARMATEETRSSYSHMELYKRELRMWGLDERGVTRAGPLPSLPAGDRAKLDALERKYEALGIRGVRSFLGLWYRAYLAEQPGKVSRGEHTEGRSAGYSGASQTGRETVEESLGTQTIQEGSRGLSLGDELDDLLAWAKAMGLDRETIEIALSEIAAGKKPEKGDLLRHSINSLVRQAMTNKDFLAKYRHETRVPEEREFEHRRLISSKRWMVEPRPDQDVPGIGNRERIGDRDVEGTQSAVGYLMDQLPTDRGSFEGMYDATKMRRGPFYETYGTDNPSPEERQRALQLKGLGRGRRTNLNQGGQSRIVWRAESGELVPFPIEIQRPGSPAGGQPANFFLPAPQSLGGNRGEVLVPPRRRKRVPGGQIDQFSERSLLDRDKAIFSLQESSHGIWMGGAQDAEMWAGTTERPRPMRFADVLFGTTPSARTFVKRYGTRWNPQELPEDIRSRGGEVYSAFSDEEIAGEVIRRWRRYREEQLTNDFEFKKEREFLEELESFQLPLFSPAGEKNIRYIDTNDPDAIIMSGADAIAHGVNLEPVMGAGIAEQLKQLYPGLYESYAKAVKSGQLQSGGMHVFQGKDRSIVNLAFMQHRGRVSAKDTTEMREKYLLESLQRLAQSITSGELKVDKLALPLIGCGFGGLTQKRYREIIEQALGGLNIPVEVYAMRDNFKNYPKGKKYRMPSSPAGGRVIIAGSRGITDMAALEEAIAQSGLDIKEVVAGGAKGVDTLARLWAERHGIAYKEFPAQWETYGKSAGYQRNEEMANYADALIALWDEKSPGTKHMIDIGKGKFGERAKIFGYSGGKIRPLFSPAGESTPTLSGELEGQIQKAKANIKGINIWSGAKGLGGALTNLTERSFSKGNIQRHYPVEFRGRSYPSAEHAYKALRSPNNARDLAADEALMAEIIAAKLQQHPILVQELEKAGGVPFLEASSHVTGAKFSNWEGQGRGSRFIRALISGYTQASRQTTSSPAGESTPTLSGEVVPGTSSFQTANAKPTPALIQALFPESPELWEPLQRVLGGTDIQEEVKRQLNESHQKNVPGEMPFELVRGEHFEGFPGSASSIGGKAVWGRERWRRTMLSQHGVYLDPKTLLPALTEGVVRGPTHIYTTSKKTGVRTPYNVDVTNWGGSIFAPTDEILANYRATKKEDKKKAEWEYTQAYLARLDKILENDPDAFAQLFGREKLVLECYEKAGEFCHRLILARYLNQIGDAYHDYMNQVAELNKRYSQEHKKTMWGINQVLPGFPIEDYYRGAVYGRKRLPEGASSPADILKRYFRGKMTRRDQENLSTAMDNLRALNQAYDERLAEIRKALYERRGGGLQPTKTVLMGELERGQKMQPYVPYYQSEHDLEYRMKNLAPFILGMEGFTSRLGTSGGKALELFGSEEGTSLESISEAYAGRDPRFSPSAIDGTIRRVEELKARHGELQNIIGERARDLEELQTMLVERGVLLARPLEKYLVPGYYRPNELAPEADFMRERMEREGGLPGLDVERMISDFGISVNERGEIRPMDVVSKLYGLATEPLPRAAHTPSVRREINDAILQYLNARWFGLNRWSKYAGIPGAGNIDEDEPTSLMDAMMVLYGGRVGDVEMPPIMERAGMPNLGMDRENVERLLGAPVMRDPEALTRAATAFSYVWQVATGRGAGHSDASEWGSWYWEDDLEKHRKAMKAKLLEGKLSEADADARVRERYPDYWVPSNFMGRLTEGKFSPEELMDTMQLLNAAQREMQGGHISLHTAERMLNLLGYSEMIPALRQRARSGITSAGVGPSYLELPEAMGHTTQESLGRMMDVLKAARKSRENIKIARFTPDEEWIPLDRPEMAIRGRAPPRFHSPESREDETARVLRGQSSGFRKTWNLAQSLPGVPGIGLRYRDDTTRGFSSNPFKRLISVPTGGISTLNSRFADRMHRRRMADYLGISPDELTPELQEQFSLLHQVHHVANPIADSGRELALLVNSHRNWATSLSGGNPLSKAILSHLPISEQLADIFASDFMVGNSKALGFSSSRMRRDPRNLLARALEAGFSFPEDEPLNEMLEFGYGKGMPAKFRAGYERYKGTFHSPTGKDTIELYRGIRRGGPGKHAGNPNYVSRFGDGIGPWWTQDLAYAKSFASHPAIGDVYHTRISAKQAISSWLLPLHPEITQAAYNSTDWATEFFLSSSPSSYHKIDWSELSSVPKRDIDYNNAIHGFRPDWRTLGQFFYQLREGDLDDLDILYRKYYERYGYDEEPLSIDDDNPWGIINRDHEKRITVLSALASNIPEWIHRPPQSREEILSHLGDKDIELALELLESGRKKLQSRVGSFNSPVSNPLDESWSDEDRRIKRSVGANLFLSSEDALKFYMAAYGDSSSREDIENYWREEGFDKQSTINRFNRKTIRENVEKPARRTVLELLKKGLRPVSSNAYGAAKKGVNWVDPKSGEYGFTPLTRKSYKGRFFSPAGESFNLESFLKEKHNLDPDQIARVSQFYGGGRFGLTTPAAAGKTKTVIAAVDALLKGKHVSPESLLMTGFTVQSAAEQHHRIGRDLGLTHEQAPYAGITFDQLIGKIIRDVPDAKFFQQWYGRPVRPRRPRSSRDLRRVLQYAAAKVGLVSSQSGNLTSSETTRIGQLQTTIEWAKMRGKYPDAFRKQHAEELGPGGPGEGLTMENVARVYEIYQKILWDQAVADYGDFAIMAYTALTKDPKVSRVWRGRFKNVFIDEAQNSNRANAVIASLVTHPEGNLLAVGDPMQNVFDWRASLGMNDEFSEILGLTQMESLSRNYRNPASILDLAGFISGRQERGVVSDPGNVFFGKSQGGLYVPFGTWEEEEQAIGQNVATLFDAGVPASEIAVLGPWGFVPEGVAGWLSQNRPDVPTRLRYSQRSMAEFTDEEAEEYEAMLAALAAQPPGVKDPRVQLRTGFSIGGGEYSHVLLGGMNDFMLSRFKTPRELAQAQRLLYVMATRAKEQLIMSGHRRKGQGSRIQTQEELQRLLARHEQWKRKNVSSEGDAFFSPEFEMDPSSGLLLPKKKWGTDELSALRRAQGQDGYGIDNIPFFAGKSTNPLYVSAVTRTALSRMYDPKRETVGSFRLGADRGRVSLEDYFRRATGKEGANQVEFVSRWFGEQQALGHTASYHSHRKGQPLEPSIEDVAHWWTILKDNPGTTGHIGMIGGLSEQGEYLDRAFRVFLNQQGGMQWEEMPIEVSRPTARSEATASVAGARRKPWEMTFDEFTRSVAGDNRVTPEQMKGMHESYMRMVSDAIDRGEPVPTHVAKAHATATRTRQLEELFGRSSPAGEETASGIPGNELISIPSEPWRQTREEYVHSRMNVNRGPLASIQRAFFGRRYSDMMKRARMERADVPEGPAFHSPTGDPFGDNLGSDRNKIRHNRMLRDWRQRLERAHSTDTPIRARGHGRLSAIMQYGQELGYSFGKLGTEKGLWTAEVSGMRGTQAPPTFAASSSGPEDIVSSEMVDTLRQAPITARPFMTTLSDEISGWIRTTVRSARSTSSQLSTTLANEATGFVSSMRSGLQAARAQAETFIGGVGGLLGKASGGLYSRSMDAIERVITSPQAVVANQMVVGLSGGLFRGRGRTSPATGDIIGASGTVLDEVEGGFGRSRVPPLSRKEVEGAGGSYIPPAGGGVNRGRRGGGLFELGGNLASIGFELGIASYLMSGLQQQAWGEAVNADKAMFDWMQSTGQDASWPNRGTMTDSAMRFLRDSEGWKGASPAQMFSLSAQVAQATGMGGMGAGEVGVDGVPVFMTNARDIAEPIWKASQVLGTDPGELQEAIFAGMQQFGELDKFRGMVETGDIAGSRSIVERRSSELIAYQRGGGDIQTLVNVGKLLGPIVGQMGLSENQFMNITQQASIAKFTPRSQAEAWRQLYEIAINPSQEQAYTMRRLAALETGPQSGFNVRPQMRGAYLLPAELGGTPSLTQIGDYTRLRGAQYGYDTAVLQRQMLPAQFNMMDLQHQLGGMGLAEQRMQLFFQRIMLPLQEMLSGIQFRMSRAQIAESQRRLGYERRIGPMQWAYEDAQLALQDRGIARSQASLNFSDWMFHQQYGSPNAVAAAQIANLNWSQGNVANARSVLTAGLLAPVPISASGANYGLSGEQFMAGWTHQREQLAFGRSRLLTGAAYQSNVEYLEKQKDFFERSAQLQEISHEFQMKQAQAEIEDQKLLREKLQAIRDAERAEQMARWDFEDSQLKDQLEALNLQETMAEKQFDYQRQSLDRADAMLAVQTQIWEAEGGLQSISKILQERAANEQVIMSAIELFTTMNTGQSGVSADLGIINEKGMVDTQRLFEIIRGASGNTTDAQKMLASLGFGGESAAYIKWLLEKVAKEGLPDLNIPPDQDVNEAYKQYMGEGSPLATQAKLTTQMAITLTSIGKAFANEMNAWATALETMNTLSQDFVPAINDAVAALVGFTTVLGGIAMPMMLIGGLFRGAGLFGSLFGAGGLLGGGTGTFASPAGAAVAGGAVGGLATALMIAGLVGAGGLAAAENSGVDIVQTFKNIVSGKNEIAIKSGSALDSRPDSEKYMINPEEQIEQARQIAQDPNFPSTRFEVVQSLDESFAADILQIQRSFTGLSDKTGEELAQAQDDLRAQFVDFETKYRDTYLASTLAFQVMDQMFTNLYGKSCMMIEGIDEGFGDASDAMAIMYGNVIQKARETMDAVTAAYVKLMEQMSEADRLQMSYWENWHHSVSSSSPAGESSTTGQTAYSSNVGTRGTDDVMDLVWDQGKLSSASGDSSWLVACGIVAAQAQLARAGVNLTPAEVRDVAVSMGLWDPSSGMHGPGSYELLLEAFGANASQDTSPTAAEAIDLVRRYGSVALDTPAHYYMANAYDPERGFHVGASGTVMGGSEWMTYQQMEALGGDIRSLIYIMGVATEQGPYAGLMQQGDFFSPAGEGIASLLTGNLVTAITGAVGSLFGANLPTGDDALTWVPPSIGPSGSEPTDMSQAIADIFVKSLQAVQMPLTKEQSEATLEQQQLVNEQVQADQVKVQSEYDLATQSMVFAAIQDPIIKNEAQFRYDSFTRAMQASAGPITTELARWLAAMWQAAIAGGDVAYDPQKIEVDVPEKPGGSAAGAIFTRPTKTTIAEAGVEGVFPLSKLDELLGTKAKPSVNVTVHQYFQGGKITDEDKAEIQVATIKAVEEALEIWDRGSK
jgi:superfamily I DNA/RNA helicase/O-acetyl-ADP-ribose deacetylase (regulator of RNase III)